MAYMVVNSRYNPFTYDELVKPLADYNTAYEKQEALADAYATAAANLDALSPDLDSAEYQNYNNWKNELKAASDLLATSGLTPEVKSTLKSLGTRFNTELNPTLEKMKTRAELVKEQRAALVKNPNLIFDTDYSATPLGSISPSSTYNTYDLDSILKEVGNDVYSRMSAGESVPSANEYLTRYSAGLSDPDKIAKVNNAISSGMSLGNSTYQQKEFDNYIKKVQASRRYSSSGGSGSTAKQGFSVMAHDGTAVNVTLNKKTGNYEIKNKNGKPVVVDPEDTENDILSKYYEGEYGYVNALGISVPKVETTEKLPDGSSRNVYSIKVGKQWIDLPKGERTTNRELYKIITKENIADLTDYERHRRNPGITEDLLTKKVKTENNPKGKWTKEPGNYHDYSLQLTESLVKKLDALEDIGIKVDLSLYKDDKGNLVGWDIDTDGPALDAPIVDSFR